MNEEITSPLLCSDGMDNEKHCEFDMVMLQGRGACPPGAVRERPGGDAREGTETSSPV